jgi:endo-1,4-beta-xylanase
MTCPPLTLLALLLLTAVVAQDGPEARTPGTIDGPHGEQKGLPLRLWAQRRNIQFGVAIDAAPLREDQQYRQLAAREFSMLTPADAMKMVPLRPTRDRFVWDDCDALVGFAEAHAQRVHGHTLVWHEQTPSWLASEQWTRDELLTILLGHVRAVVARYKGRVHLWDVVNEAIEEDGSPRQSLWHRVIGPDYIEQAFRAAHEIDPAATLVYNDYNGEGLGKKSTAIYELLRDLRSRNVPVHGVGLQMHMTVGKLPSLDDFRANLRRLAELGLEVHVTEADVRIPLPATPDALDEQAKNYHQLLKIALEFPELRSWTIWGVSDRYSWVPRAFKGFGAALPWDENHQAKPAKNALEKALRGVAP